MEKSMHKIEIITRTRMLEPLKDALNEIGITGITVSQVLGCGMQKGATELYRGVPVDINLLPKVKLEIVVSEIPVQTVLIQLLRYFVLVKSVMVKSLYTM